jgi:hypothetical protein
MGFAITWIACSESHADAVLRQLSLTATGKTEEVPDAPISQFRTKSDWRIIWVNAYGCSFLGQDQLAKLSRSADIVHCLVEEHVMASSAELWSQGRRHWRIAHEGENGPVGLETEGTPPAAFPGIRADLEREQEEAGGKDADVDHLFDIPLKVAESLTGFKHDVVIEGDFEILTRDSPKPAGFFKRLFGN